VVEPGKIEYVALSKCEELIDFTAELLGQRFRRCQIREELRKINPEISNRIITLLIAAARRKLIATYNVNPEQYKGEAIEFYSYVIRNSSFPIKFRIQAQERLDKLLGLEALKVENPEEYISRLNAALQAMDKAIPNEDSKEKESVKESESKKPQEESKFSDPDVSVLEEISSSEEFEELRSL